MDDLVASGDPRPMVRALVIVATMTGARRGELQSLRSGAMSDGGEGIGGAPRQAHGLDLRTLLRQLGLLGAVQRYPAGIEPLNWSTSISISQK